MSILKYSEIWFCTETYHRIYIHSISKSTAKKNSKKYLKVAKATGNEKKSKLMKRRRSYS